MEPQALSELQMDALTEIGSIGAGHAATALSQLVDHAITLEVPRLELLSVKQIPTIFGGPEALAAGVYSQLLGDLEGSILFVISRESALCLIDMLHNREVGTTKALSRPDEQMLEHTAAIVGSSYIAAIARMTDLSVLPSKPLFAFDMVGGILEAVAIDVGMLGDEALLLRTEFVSDGSAEEPDVIDAYLLFLPSPDSLGVLLGRLGMG